MRGRDELKAELGSYDLVAMHRGDQTRRDFKHPCPTRNTPLLRCHIICVLRTQRLPLVYLSLRRGGIHFCRTNSYFDVPQYSCFMCSFRQKCALSYSDRTRFVGRAAVVRANTAAPMMNQRPAPLHSAPWWGFVLHEEQ